MNLRSNLRTAAFAALGMLAVQLASRFLPPGVTAAQAQRPPDRGVVTARELEIVDAQGRRLIVMATGGEGTPGLWMYDRDGKVRLSMGLYGDGNVSVVLNDHQERAVEIVRTVGPASDPVLVLKTAGRDRVILGLKGDKSDPGFVTFDAQGRKKAVFGDY